MLYFVLINHVNFICTPYSIFNFLCSSGSGLSVSALTEMHTTHSLKCSPTSRLPFQDFSSDSDSDTLYSIRKTVDMTGIHMLCF